MDDSRAEPASFLERPSVRPKWLRLFAIDLRSLAAFRIALGCVLLLDVLSRLGNLTAHYTDAGVLPIEVLKAGLRPSIGAWIATHLPGDVTGQAVVFSVYGLAALLLLVGSWTRAATIVCWLCTLAVMARNPLVLHRADVLLKMLLFWGMFLPLGARWSVDRYRSPGAGAEWGAVVSPASAALLLQPCLMYWFAVASRNHLEWWSEASALYFASHADIIVRPLGATLRELPEGALRGLTRSVILCEVALPLALWSPWANPRVRRVALAGIVAMLVAFGSAFNIGYFPLMAFVSLIPFLPGSVWERLGPPAGAGLRGRGGWPAWALSLVVLFTIALNFDTNLERVSLPGPLRGVGVFFGLEQQWDIFSPAPPKEDEWLVVVALLADGSVVDLVHGTENPVLDKPEDFAAYWSDYRWRRYWYSLRTFAPLQDYYVRYAVERWNGEHPPERHVESARIELLREPTPPFGSSAQTIALERRTVWPRPRG